MVRGNPLFCSLDAANQLYITFRTLGFPTLDQVPYLGPKGYEQLTFPMAKMSPALPSKLPSLYASLPPSLPPLPLFPTYQPTQLCASFPYHSLSNPPPA